LKGRRFDEVLGCCEDLERELGASPSPGARYKVKNAKNEILRALIAARAYEQAEKIARSFLNLVEVDRFCPNRISVVHQLLGRIRAEEGDCVGAEEELRMAVNLSLAELREIQKRIRQEMNAPSAHRRN
jgi:hypothetical protein